MAEKAQVAEVAPSVRRETPVLYLVKDLPDVRRTAARQSRWEIAGLALLSVSLHAGIALALRAQRDTAPTHHVSKVDIEFARPPEPPKPKVVPPPPPPVQKAAPQNQAAPKPLAPADEPPAPPVEDQPVDTGSSAEAADDGNLFAGKGGSGVAPPRPVSAPAPSAPPPAPIIEAREGANYSKNPRPGYPARAIREGWQGVVLVRVQVLPNGRTGLLKLQKTSGFALLDDAALAAIKSWSFVPAKQAGQAVSGWVTVPIAFRLQ
jgi:periplasmic protein TonB